MVDASRIFAGRRRAHGQENAYWGEQDHRVSSGPHITNRWSSRLGGRLELLVQTRKEDRSLGVVGGAAQLDVIHAQEWRPSVDRRLISLDRVEADRSLENAAIFREGVRGGAARHPMA
jgi:hypothetical protein